MSSLVPRSIDTMHRWPVFALLTVLLGCQEAEECGQWTDFAASVGIDESQTLHCSSYSDNSPDEDVAKVRACLWTAYDQGQLAKMHQSRSVEGTNADVVSTGVTTYVRPPDREPRLLEFRTVTELWEDGSTTEETSAWACDDVTTTDAPSVGCRVYRRLCP